MATPNLTAITTVAPGILNSVFQLSSGANTIYTVGGSKAARIETMTLTNNTSSAVTVSVSVVPSGGSVDATHVVVSSYSLAANDSTTITEVAGLWLGAGAFISVNAGTGSAVNALVTGLEFS